MTEKLMHLTSITVEVLFIPFKALRDENERRLFRYEYVARWILKWIISHFLSYL